MAKNRALMLSWPYRKEDGSDTWDAVAVSRFKGDHIIHIGIMTDDISRYDPEDDVVDFKIVPLKDKKPEYGGKNRKSWTTSEECEIAIKSSFICRKRLELPTWPHHQNVLTVWKRKKEKKK